MTVFQAYGVQQHMALAARHLFSIDEGFHHVLYRDDVEMLYYFVEPILSEIINKVHSGEIHSLEEMIDEVNDLKGRPSV